MAPRLDKRKAEEKLARRVLLLAPETVEGGRMGFLLGVKARGVRVVPPRDWRKD